MSELRRVFDSFDTSSDGAISVDEMCAALQSMNMGMAREKVVAMLAAADVDTDGKVSFAEFVKVADRGKSSAQLSQFNEVIQQKKTIVQVKWMDMASRSAAA